MKTFIYLFVILTISLVSCEKETISEAFSVGLDNDFKINYDYHSIDNYLSFTITEINDSRCPSDVVCVWEGKADVKIEVKTPTRGSVLLSTYNHRIDTLGNYSFELKDISPYPISTKTIKLEDYNVTLKIVELNY